VVLTAQAFELAEIELGSVTVVRLDVVDDFGGPHKADGEASFAQRLASELVPSKPTPSSVVVRAASGVAALAAAAGMQVGEGIGAHVISLLGTQRHATSRLKVDSTIKPPLASRFHTAHN